MLFVEKPRNDREERDKSPKKGKIRRISQQIYLWGQENCEVKNCKKNEGSINVEWALTRWQERKQNTSELVPAQSNRKCTLMANQPLCGITGYRSVGGDRTKDQSGFYFSYQDTDDRKSLATQISVSSGEDLMKHAFNITKVQIMELLWVHVSNVYIHETKSTPIHTKVEADLRGNPPVVQPGWEWQPGNNVDSYDNQQSDSEWPSFLHWTPQELELWYQQRPLAPIRLLIECRRIWQPQCDKY
ncbi:hypothetical protein MJT46_008794 [Ovis ammon polii x Ovis aries]|nr:hypothetical protein MJT46_008794 [Ovis ammon polii x Ovis aries]